MAPRSEAGDSAEGKRGGGAQGGGPGGGPAKQYTCPHCSYSADKKVSLNRHMRMHTASPPAATGAVAPPLQVQVAPAEATSSAADPAAFVDRYCQDCDIRFSSLKTFRAHKLHYCSTRHVLKGSAAPGSSESASPSPVEGAGRTSAPSPGSDVLLALPTNPPLLVPYSLLQAASVVQGSALGAALGPALGAACLLWLPDGSLQPVATVNLTSPVRHRSAPAPLPAPSPSPQSQPSASRRRERDSKSSPAPPSGHTLGTGPLDLSLRRSSDCSDQDDDEKVSHMTSTSDHEDIVCAPSIPLMLSASSTCSSPSPAPPLGPSPSPPPPAPPPSRKRPHSPPVLSPTPGGKRPHSPNMMSPTPGKKSPRRTPNGVVPHVAKKEAMSVDEAAAGVSAAAAADVQLLLQSVLASRGLPPVLPPALLNNLLNAPLELARMAAASAASAASELQPPPPQVLVKHGVSKCKECNIVFCRHENYLAHKRHYCQARLQDDLAHSAAEDGAPSPGSARISRSPSANSPPEAVPQPPSGTVSPATPAVTPTPATLVQYTCALCLIKFTALDNLTHHQAYYCPKRASQENAPTPAVKIMEDKSRRRCPKCKVSVPADQLSSHQCDVLVVGSGWRCPCCPVMSPTVSAAQRHMETHNGIKAFRCTLCGYKGNTLRGMRTHIRIHFEKGLPDLQEENFITCVMEDDAALPAPVSAPMTTPPTPPAPLSTVTATTDVSTLPGAGPPESDPEPQFACDLCSYTTMHKRNIVHHSKNVHGRSFEEAASSTSSNSSRTSEDQKPTNALNGSERIAIKEEQNDEEFVSIEEFKVKEEPGLVSDMEEQTSMSVRASPLVIEESKPAIKGSDEMHVGDEELGANNNKSGPKYCKSCDISFTYYDNFMAHKKFYCRRSEPENKVAQASAL